MAGAVRRTGLPWHLLYPIILLVLIAIAAFTSASSVWLVSANTLTTQIRFGPRDYCGYNVTIVQGVRYYDALGCIASGWSYQVDPKNVGINLPGAISTSLSKGAALLLLCFVLILVASMWHAYATRYSFRSNPKPNKPKLYTMVSIHLALANGTALFVWLTFVVIAAIAATAASYKGADHAKTLQEGGVRVWWGASPWLILSAGIVSLPWAYEAVQWRYTEVQGDKS